MKARQREFSLGLFPKAFMMFKVSIGLPHSIGGFIRNFRTMMAPTTEVIKGSSFK